MAGKMTFNKPGIYLLGGAVAIGTVSYANAQDKPRNFIYGDKELTAAGDGTFAKSYVNEVNMSPDNSYSIKSRFSSKDKINYSCTDAKKELKRIINGMGPDNKLTEKEIAFKKYLKGLARTLNTNDKASLELLDNAVKDGIISPRNDSLYNERGWKIKDDTYLVFAKTGKESVPILYHFKLKSLEEVKESELEKKAGFGLEAGIGSNNEKVLSAFVDIPLASWLSLEGFGSWYAARGNPTHSGKSTEITARQRELIGPETYKQRTDEIITSIEEKAIADIGAGLTFKPNDYVEIPLRIGKEFSNQHKTLDGKSTIIHERKGQLLEAPSVITNSKDCGNSAKSNLYLSAGARWNLGKKLFMGVSFNKMGRKNSGRISLRYAF